MSFFSPFKDQVGTLVMSDMAENALVSTQPVKQFVDTPPPPPHL